MESLDREIAAAFSPQAPKHGPGRLLIVGEDSRPRGRLDKKLVERGHRLMRVASLDEGLSAVGRERFDLVLLSAVLPDGDGLQLAECVRKISPTTKTMLLFSSDSFNDAARALRGGVVDLVDVSVGPKELADRVEAALAASRADRQRDDRLAQLEVVCKKLIAAREEVSEHLDALCQDLAAAYQDVSVQLNEVAMASEFRTLLKQELDLEDLLRTALEYLLAKTGPTNAAVFLPDAAGQFDLGAYVNYDCPRETITVLLNHLCRAVCPQMAEEAEIVSFEDAEAFAKFIGADAGFLAGCQVIAFACRHAERCLAVMVLFRSREEPFDESLAPTIEILRTIFGEQVHQVIKVHHRASGEWPKDPLDEGKDVSDYDDFGFGGMAA